MQDSWLGHQHNDSLQQAVHVVLPQVLHGQSAVL